MRCQMDYPRSSEASSSSVLLASPSVSDADERSDALERIRSLEEALYRSIHDTTDSIATAPVVSNRIRHPEPVDDEQATLLGDRRTSRSSRIKSLRSVIPGGHGAHHNPRKTSRGSGGGVWPSAEALKREPLTLDGADFSSADSLPVASQSWSQAIPHRPSFYTTEFRIAAKEALMSHSNPASPLKLRIIRGHAD